MTDFKSYYESYNRENPSSTYRPENEATYLGRLLWFSRHLPSGAKILEYGCGEGVLLAGLAQRQRIHPDSCGVDISQNAIRKATTRYPQLKFTTTDSQGKVSFKEATFDAIIASEVIEHVFDTDGMFGEFSRLLRPKGFLLLSCPYHGLLKDALLLLTGTMDLHYHNPYSMHIRYYSVATLQKVFDRHGFHLAQWGGIGRLPFLWKSMVVAAEKTG